MKVQLTEGQVNIDDGRLTVIETFGGYYVRADGFATIEANSSPTPTHPSLAKDPHYYYTGQNGLTVEESAERAFDRVEDMILSAGVLGGDPDDVTRTIEAIIADEDTDGRHTVYKVAGGVVKGMKEGTYAGVPFSVLFENVVNGKITPPGSEKTLSDVLSDIVAGTPTVNYSGRGA